MHFYIDLRTLQIDHYVNIKLIKMISLHSLVPRLWLGMHLQEAEPPVDHRKRSLTREHYKAEPCNEVCTQLCFSVNA